MRRRFLPAILIGIGSVAVVVMGCRAEVKEAQPPPSRVDYLAPARQADRPPVAWMREFDPGVGGSLITDRNGGIYLWYLTDSHVLKYDRHGKVLWDKKFAPRGHNLWGAILANQKGDLFMARRTGGTQTLARLLPNGTFVNDIRLPGTQGEFAVDASGGRIGVDFIPQGSDELTGREHLTKYSSTGVREWSTYLQDRTWSPDYRKPQLSSILHLDIDAQGNSYLLFGDVTLGGTTTTKLMKFRSDGKLAGSTPLELRSDAALDVRLDAAGNTYIVGQQKGLGYYIAKFGPDGKQVWVRRPQAGDMLEKLQMTVDRSGNIYIAGSAPKVDEQKLVAPFVAKHDTSGRLLWRKELPKITMVIGLAVDSNGVYVSGAVQGAGGKMYLVKLGK